MTTPAIFICKSPPDQPTRFREQSMDLDYFSGNLKDVYQNHNLPEGIKSKGKTPVLQNPG